MTMFSRKEYIYNSGLTILKRSAPEQYSENHSKMTLENLLNAIRDNPTIYLGQMSLTRLSAFLDGYILGSNCATFLPMFQEWVAEKYGVKTSHKWNEIILFYEQDEQSGFSRFFTLVDEFAMSNSLHDQPTPRE